MFCFIFGENSLSGIGRMEQDPCGALAKMRWQLETGRRWGCGWKWADGKSMMQPAASAGGGTGRCGQRR